VETPLGTTTFSGANHEEFHDKLRQSFDQAHLSSERFTYAEVQAMIGERRPAK
jgi:hypothetical protein